MHQWVHNFVPDKEPILVLTAWVRISFLSVEYFDEQFLQVIGSKIGTIRKVDNTTAYVERGKFVCMCVEVYLSKPLLLKFRRHGRVWRVQHEGLHLICFKCGKVGHKG